MAGCLEELATIQIALICYNISMTEEELNTISESIKEKIGEENFATISDDMGKIITGRSSMEKEISERDTTITGLKEKNQQLVDANASLFKQIPTSSSNTSSKNDDEDELPLSKTSLRDAFDKNGNFKH